MKIKLDLTFKITELNGTKVDAKVNEVIANTIANSVSKDAKEASLIAMRLFNNAKPEVDLIQFRLIESIIDGANLGNLVKSQIQDYLKTVKTT